MTLTYIALGSNLEQPLLQVTQAITALKTLGNLQAQSPWYRSQAIGPADQPDYINGVVALETELSPHELLKQLQAIEQKQGRVRDIRWGARTLDLDILLYGEQIIESADLQIPHPRMKERAFVIFPLSDIAPQLQLPCGENVMQLKPALQQQQLEKLP
jgi:2-amino-4-hydroxy-6-hydroxymethyldihydropteridine diphosphokinase